MKKRRISTVIQVLLGIVLISSIGLYIFPGFLGSIGLDFDIPYFTVSEYTDYEKVVLDSANATGKAVSCTAIQKGFQTGSEEEKKYFSQEWSGWRGGICEKSENGVEVGITGEVTLRCGGLRQDSGCRVKGFQLPQKISGSRENWMDARGQPLYNLYYESFPKGSAELSGFDSRPGYEKLLNSFEERNVEFQKLSDLEKARIVGKMVDEEVVEGREAKKLFADILLDDETPLNSVLTSRTLSKTIAGEDLLKSYQEFQGYRGILEETGFENVKKFETTAEKYFDAEEPFQNSLKEANSELSYQLTAVFENVSVELEGLVEEMSVIRRKRQSEIFSNRVLNVSNGSSYEEVEKGFEQVVEHGDSFSTSFLDEIDNNKKMVLGTFEEFNRSQTSFSEGFIVDSAERNFLLSQHGPEFFSVESSDSLQYSSDQYLENAFNSLREAGCSTGIFSTSVNSISQGDETSMEDNAFAPYCEEYSSFEDLCRSDSFENVSEETVSRACSVGSAVLYPELRNSFNKLKFENQVINSLVLQKQGTRDRKVFKLHPYANRYLVEGETGFRTMHLSSPCGSEDTVVEFNVEDTTCSALDSVMEFAGWENRFSLPGEGVADTDRVPFPVMFLYKGSFFRSDECGFPGLDCGKSPGSVSELVASFPETSITYSDSSFVKAVGENRSFPENFFKISDPFDPKLSNVEGLTPNSTLDQEIKRKFMNIMELELRKNRQIELDRAQGEIRVNGSRAWFQAYDLSSTAECENVGAGFVPDNCRDYSECRVVEKYRGDPREYIGWGEYCEKVVSNITEIRRRLLEESSFSKYFSQIGYWRFTGNPENPVPEPYIPEKKIGSEGKGSKKCVSPELVGERFNLSSSEIEDLSYPVTAVKVSVVNRSENSYCDEGGVRPVVESYGKSSLTGLMDTETIVETARYLKQSTWKGCTENTWTGRSTEKCFENTPKVSREFSSNESSFLNYMN